MVALTANAQTIQTAPSMSGPWTNAAVLAGPQGFARLLGPGGRSAAVGTMLTITNATPTTNVRVSATLSNGVLSVNASIASNSLKQIESMTLTNLALKLNLVGQ